MTLSQTITLHHMSVPNGKPIVYARIVEIKGARAYCQTVSLKRLSPVQVAAAKFWQRGKAHSASTSDA